ncbi:DUF1080 domain-containing protein [Echinicola sp. 20G]|uniref:3-keto-disaccharide hydrolase n=1 Tax=Echinicola sp. 20G TaxID=2781961 RepID=UPI001910000B|nr:DUF1080 domain-containing protein [Echinicola sp. 20G]
MRIFKLRAYFVCLLCYVIFLPPKYAIAQSVNQKWPGNINPAALQENTQPEPDLNKIIMTDLFNGRDLTGWSVKGGSMIYSVEDENIVGTCDPEERLNSFLVTETSYDDFIFTAEFKWDVLGNSGVMFRADTRPLEKGERPIVKDRSLLQVYGYQCEVETTNRKWTGGIYGEAMGGWIYPLSKEKEHQMARNAIIDHQEWNRVTIYAKGDQILTWINGVPCANLRSQERKDGFIGLQVHQGRKGQIRWRNLRIKDFSK